VPTLTPTNRQTTSTTFSLVWTASSGATSYQLFASPSDTAGSYGLLTTTTQTQTNITTGLGDHYYKVEACNSVGCSAMSNSAHVLVCSPRMGVRSSGVLMETVETATDRASPMRSSVKYNKEMGVICGLKSESGQQGYMSCEQPAISSDRPVERRFRIWGALAAGVLAFGLARVQAVPSAIIGRPALIAPTAADAYFPTTQDTCGTCQTSTLGTPAPTPAEIVELARALGTMWMRFMTSFTTM